MRILAVFPIEMGYDFGVAVEDDLSNRKEVAVIPCWTSPEPLVETEHWMPVIERVVAYLDPDGMWIDTLEPTIRMANAMMIPIEYRTIDVPPGPSFLRRISESLREWVS